MEHIKRAVEIGVLIGALIGILVMWILFLPDGEMSLQDLPVWIVFLMFFSASGALPGMIIGAIVGLVKSKSAS